MVGWGWIITIGTLLLIWIGYHVFKDIIKAESGKRKQLIITWTIVLVLGVGIFCAFRFTPIYEMVNGPQIEATEPFTPWSEDE